MNVRRDGRSVVLALRGELDHDSVEQLRDAGNQELAEGRAAGPVVVDCAALSFCDSSGIGELVRLHQQMALRSRAVRLASVPAPVSRLFQLTGLHQVLSVHADVDGALAVDRGDAVAAGAEGPVLPNEGHRA
ncbi:STAS domain-containing protein [Streptomyces sp. NBC_00083]|uniref:STAS domain-containing protein n=1 Tax=Streptomyces sp. NBC_00083 TaxID=2975647 RepID=UPI002253D476|nr:STAS domain-containing protein [Streptomyces sp. NBC_00083]MCX5384563.1 STAS domain-containing protein [Streptomyces sp. NBC_00083]